MCECRERIEGKLKERHIHQNPQAKDHDAKLIGYGFRITDNGCQEACYMPAELRSTVTVKKTGAAKCKVDKINMHFTYCPFCGEKYPA